MRRTAYRAAISAGPSTDSIGDTIPFHRVHRFVQPGCYLPSLRHSHGYSLCFCRIFPYLRIICFTYLSNREMCRSVLFDKFAV